uniref:Galactose-3-O-sulfotransferase 2-like n=1 Tax=Branchiostoma floridae TaxID=7739 RepID=C3ZSE2_BRAFL|eukprot:XP_002588561.1 hypothetical protein BRAFLDRAFT_79511 [Branchiostoma floridae]
MNYYFLPKLLKIKSNNPFKTFLENPWKYQNLSEVHYEGFNVTWDPTRNFMSFDLGYPAEAAEDMERARRYVSELQADFTLVMLLDYFDESYVLLKRLMCWELRDILYVTKNNRSYSFKEYTPSEKELEELRRWKAVDYLLYDTFNKSLWEKIAAQGPDFYEEVEFLKDVNGRVNTYCKERQKETPNLVVETSKWNPSMFEVDADFCRVLQAKVSYDFIAHTETLAIDLRTFFQNTTYTLYFGIVHLCHINMGQEKNAEECTEPMPEPEPKTKKYRTRSGNAKTKPWNTPTKNSQEFEQFTDDHTDASKTKVCSLKLRTAPERIPMWIDANKAYFNESRESETGYKFT